MEDSNRTTSPPLPDLHIPASNSIVTVSIIDTTTELVCPAWAFVHPVRKGHEYINMPTYAFLIHNAQLKKTVLFDLGCRKDWWNLAPATRGGIVRSIPGIRVSKSMNEILQQGNVKVEDIDAVILSHAHFDHTGDMSLFPSAELVLGPGILASAKPGYPARKDSNLLESDLSHRKVTELVFDSSSLQIGSFRAHDFWGDGSFYLLETPGHARGHMSGLVRTTPETFVLMGGDICHFCGVFRPNKWLPFPAEHSTDSGSSQPDDSTTPFYQITKNPKGYYVDLEAAQQSVNRLQVFDANENIFVCIAHDTGLSAVVDYFPNDTLNDWKAKGWKTKSMWGYLNEMPRDGKANKPCLVEARMKDGRPLTGEALDQLV